MPPPRTSARVRVEAVPRRRLRRSVVIPRWTTARAVSSGADFRLRVAEPTWSPSKDKIGSVASSERIPVLGEVALREQSLSFGILKWS